MGDRYRYRLDDDRRVPDPASRYNPLGVHGPSQIVDPRQFRWQDGDWRGRPWEEAVIYELHVGAFTPEGSFTAVKERLDYLVDLGVTAIELMPLADFPGARNWGYDGVLLYAPAAVYGHPDELKELVQAAHQHGLMVLLDVVYNHFGPEGNYLYNYARPFFSDHHTTPWGLALDYSNRAVRDFIIHNALYWLEEFHLDGLRVDAAHVMHDASHPHILEELAHAVRIGPGRHRHCHLVLENDHNAVHWLGWEEHSGPRLYNAQWNDDLHHAMHVLLTGETEGWYGDYADRPVWYLGRCLSEGFGYQGEPSPWRHGRPRGERSRQLPSCAFISFLQNHDQVGNRAFGERIQQLAGPDAVRAMTAALLLAPPPPLLFMGQEFAAGQPFLFFCDFEKPLAKDVTLGRRKDFARFKAFQTPRARARIPDPNARMTFQRSKLNWKDLHEPPHADWLALHRELLALRRREITPRLTGMPEEQSRFETLGDHGLRVQWILGDGSVLILMGNFGAEPVRQVKQPVGRVLYASAPESVESLAQGVLSPWSVAWFLIEV